MRKYIFGLMVVIIVVLIFVPIAAGFFLQKKYQDAVAFYNAHSQNHITIKDYQRHGWTSDVTLEVRVQQKELPSYLQTGNSESMLPPFKVEQHIQHGPLIYGDAKNLPMRLGWAAVKNKIVISPELARYLNSIEILDQNIYVENFVSLAGHYFSYFTVPSITIQDAKNHTKWTAKNVVTRFWVFPRQERVKGTVKAGDFFVENADDTLALSSVKIQFNQYIDHDVWLGTDEIDIDKLLWKETDEQDFRLADIHLEGFTQKKKELFDINRKMTVKELQFDDYTMGPLTAHVSLNQFKFSALRDLLNAFREVAAEGEYYDGQLQQKIRLILPNMVTKDSVIQVNHFSLTAPHGNIEVGGAIKWPEENFDAASDLHNLLMMAQLTLDVRVSKSLMTDLMQFASAMPDSIRDAASSDRALLLEVRNQMNFAEQRNLSFIQFLLDNDYISDETGDILLGLQKNPISIDEYTAKMKALLLKKQIALIVSYQLRWQYAQMMKSYDFLTQRAESYQKAAEKQIQGQFNDLLKRGYVKENDEDYTALLQWSSDGWTSNKIKVK